MKKHRLMLSAATAALLAAPVAMLMPGLAGAALADTEITTATKQALLTSTAGNVVIDPGGSISIKAATPVITLNSNNSIQMNGNSSIANLDTTNAEGILIDTSAGNIISPNGIGFQNAGTIDLSGKGSNKFGIAVLGSNTLLGSVTLATGTVVNVVGDDSTAVYLARYNNIDGNMELAGTISHTPPDKDSNRDATRLIDLQGTIHGNFFIDPGATLINVGPGSRGVSILGAIQPSACGTDAALYAQAGTTCPTTGYGAFVTSGTVTVTGSLTPSTKKVNDESGAALVVGASVAGGIMIGGPASGFPTATTGSFAGNGTTEPVVLFDPSQPALTGLFGVTAPIAVGIVNTDIDASDGAAVGTTSCAGLTTCYSFINHGTIAARPQDSELPATAMSLVGVSATNNITFAGGLLDTGTISSVATTTTQSHISSANVAATAIYVGAYANIPNITVKAETTSGTATTSGNVNAQVNGNGGGTATAILLGTGANVPVITVGQHATLLASVLTTTTQPGTGIANVSTPFNLLAEAIVDQSGNLKTVNNGGNIIASTTVLNPDAGAVVNNVTRAIDMSLGSAGGVTINNTGIILGDVLLSAGGNGNTVNVGNTGTAVINATGVTPTQGSYAVLASRIDAQPSLAPPVTEANTLNFGSGTGHTLNVGAYGYVNSVIKAASPGAVTVNLATSGILSIANAASDGTVNANQFNINGGTLIMPLAQSTSTIPVPVVTANSATISSAATLGTQFTSFFSSGFTTASVTNPTAQQIVLVQTPTGQLHIDAATLTQDNAYLVANLPYLFRVPTAPILTTQTVGTNDQLLLTITPKTPAELGLTGDAAALFPRAAASLVYDPQLGTAIANNITVRTPSGAIDNTASAARAQQYFSQFAPDVSGGARQVAIMLTDQATGPVAARQRLLRSFGNQPGEMTLWSDEFAGMINNKGRVDADGSLTNYKDHGFGFSVGLDAGSARGGWYGGAFTFYTGDVSQSLPRTTKTDTEWYMLTGYTDWRGKHVFLDTKLDVGYGNFVGHRDMTVGTVAREATGKRAGLVASLGATTGVELKYGGFGVTPHISLDGMSLRENGYYETGGEALNLQVAPYYGNSLRGALGVDFKTAFNMWDVTLTPEARLGYRYDVVGVPAKVRAGFVTTGGLNATGNSFTFTGPDPDSGNVLAGFSLGGATDTWQLGLNYDWVRGNNGSTTQIGTLTILARI